MFRTSSGAPFHFSWHVGDLGNTFICGPSGSGKTVVLINTIPKVAKAPILVLRLGNGMEPKIAIAALIASSRHWSTWCAGSKA